MTVARLVLSIVLTVCWLMSGPAPAADPVREIVQLTEPWRGDIERLAALTSAHCQLSGLATEAGADRDVNLASDYGNWIVASETPLARLDEADRRDIVGLNARCFYRID